MDENREKLLKALYHDKPIINALWFRKIGNLSIEFGIFAYYNLATLYKNIALAFNNMKYSKEKLKNAYFNLKILLFNRGKLWKSENNLKFN